MQIWHKVLQTHANRLQVHVYHRNWLHLETGMAISYHAGAEKPLALSWETCQTSSWQLHPPIVLPLCPWLPFQQCLCDLKSTKSTFTCDVQRSFTTLNHPLVELLLFSFLNILICCLSVQKKTFMHLFFRFSTSFSPFDVSNQSVLSTSLLSNKKKKKKKE